MDSLIDALGSARLVFLDTPPIIYFAQEDPRFFDIVAPLIASIQRGERRALSTLITLVEVLTKPIELEQYDVAARFRDLLTNSPELSLVPLDVRVAEHAATIRARHKYKLPDALQLASAVVGGAEAFVTNDEALRGFGELPVLVLRNFTQATLF